MYKHVMIPTDGSALSQKAIEHGIALAKSNKARVTALTVTVPFHVFAVDPGMVTDSPERYEEHAAARASKALNVAREAAKTAGVSCDAVWIEHEHPYRAIIDAAEKNACDLIVMSSHGRRGISAVVLGSETVKILTHSAIPVLVIRTPQPAPSISAVVLERHQRLQANVSMRRLAYVKSGKIQILIVRRNTQRVLRRTD